MKTRALLIPVSLIVPVVFLLFACSNPLSPGSGSKGTLTVSIGNNVNALTLTPPLDMNAASYTVSGVGPSGATFSQSTSSGSVTVSNLTFGSWTVTVNALNAEGAVIGSGQGSTTVTTGATSTVAITVTPLAGNGSLSLSVSWPAAQVEFPSIQATLTPTSGSPLSLTFSISGSTATYSGTTIPAGYWTLALQLLDNGIPVMGAVDVARILASQTTSGTYSFSNVNQPGGAILVNITPALANPIPVTITGVPTSVTAGTGITATATATDGTSNVVYVWYLNGVSEGTGGSYTFGSALANGTYRLDVTGFTTDGTRAGSTSATFTVTGGNAEPTLTVVAGSGGTVAPNGAESVFNNAPTTITATPSGGNVFSGWTVTNGSGVSFGNASSASTTVTLTEGSGTIEAVFAP